MNTSPSAHNWANVAAYNQVTAAKATRDKLIKHKQYIAKHGEDLPEIRNWKWGAQ